MPERIEITEQKTFEQLGLLVLDGSGSMKSPGETKMAKADEVNMAVRDLIARLQASRHKKNFMLGMVSYDDKVKADRVPPTPVLQLDATADYNPLVGHGGETAIGDALQAACDVAKRFLNDQSNVPRTVVIVLMSDGQNTCGADPVTVVANLGLGNERITICAAGYGKGSDLDELTLKGLVSRPDCYQHTYNAEALRDFFFKSISQQKV